MKSIHRRTLWFHTVYSLGMMGLLVVIVVLAKSVEVLIIAGFLMAYVAGQALIHLKRKTFTAMTIVEYCLLALAVMIVLAGALT